MVFSRKSYPEDLKEVHLRGTVIVHRQVVVDKVFALQPLGPESGFPEPT